MTASSSTLIRVTAILAAWPLTMVTASTTFVQNKHAKNNRPPAQLITNNSNNINNHKNGFVNDERLAPLVHSDVDDVLITRSAHHEAQLTTDQEKPRPPQPEHLGRIVESKANSQCLSLSHTAAAAAQKHNPDAPTPHSSNALSESSAQNHRRLRETGIRGHQVNGMLSTPDTPRQDNHGMNEVGNNNYAGDRNTDETLGIRGGRNMKSNAKRTAKDDRVTHSLYASQEYWVDRDRDQELVADVYFYEHRQASAAQAAPERAPPQPHRRLKENTVREGKKLGQFSKEKNVHGNESPMDAYHPRVIPTAMLPRQQNDRPIKSTSSSSFPDADQVPTLPTHSAALPDVEDAYDENSLIALRGARGAIRRLRARFERVDRLIILPEPSASMNTGKMEERQLMNNKQGGKVVVGIASAAATALLMLLCVWVLYARRRYKSKDNVVKSSASLFFEGSHSTENVSEIEIASEDDVAADDAGNYNRGDLLKEAAQVPRAPITPSFALASSKMPNEALGRCESIHLGRMVGPAMHHSSPKSVISALTVVAGEMEEKGESKPAAEAENELSLTHNFSSMYRLIAQLMLQQEVADSEPDESHFDEEVVSVRSARSDATVAEMFYDTKSLDMDQRHRRQPSILDPVEQQCNEVAWTEFERQSSSQTESCSGSHEVVDDDSSLKEFMCKHYGALSTRVPPAAKGRLEL